MSYFPSDIPYMTDEEMEEHGINAKRERGTNTDKLWTAIRGIEHQLNNLKGELIDIDEETTQSADEAYQKGLEDGRNETWEAAKKVVLCADEGGLSIEKLNKIFDCFTIQQVFRRYTVSEVIEKLKAYEEKQKAEDEIMVGDEVRDNDGETYVITCINDDGTFDALYPDGTAFSRADFSIIYELTGRHFEIDKILEEMKK